MKKVMYTKQLTQKMKNSCVLSVIPVKEWIDLSCMDQLFLFTGLAQMDNHPWRENLITVDNLGMNQKSISPK